MDYNGVLQVGYKILEEAGIDSPQVTIPNFLDFADLVRDAILEWPKERQENTRWLVEFATSLQKLRDNFEVIVKADPLILYRPAHHVSLEFHKSTALVRYFRCGNGCSKTQSAAYDNYAVLTGQMRYRPISMPPNNIFVVGLSFSKYAPAVFEKKYLTGEPGNPLSPVFPEGGAWFNHYDPKKHIITICCEDCHDRKRPKECTHTRSTIQLFSDREGAGVLAGGQYAQGQFDEEIGQEFKEEALQRFRGVPTASLMVTGTPLGGKGRWEHQELTLVHEQGGKANLVGDSDRVLVSLHTIDQFSAGLEDPNAIKARMSLMSPAEAEARVYGRPSAYAETGVFDKFALSNMFDEVRKPNKHVELLVRVEEGMKVADALQEPELLARFNHELMRIEAREIPDGAIAIWEDPKPECQYIVGADVAFGLRAPSRKGRLDGDFSCAQVLKLTRHGLDIHFEQVACYHDHINPSAYADVLYKLGVYYNDAIVVVERSGPGHTTIRRLAAELGYPQLYRDITDPSQVEWSPHSLFGLDTNVKTKGIIISLLQKVVHDPESNVRALTLYDYNSVEELGHFGQETTESGLSYRFRGLNGAKDDRVMALAMAIYATMTNPDLYDISKEMRELSNTIKQRNDLTKEERSFWDDVHKERQEEETWEKEQFWEW